jgi:hypothetical protein
LNSAILAVVPDEKVDNLLKRVHELDVQYELQGIHAYVWGVEKMI